MGTKYNVEGVNGRNCPRCFRPGTLTGPRVHGCLMDCSSCAAQFRLDQRDPAGPTLHHITFEDLWNAGARQADDYIPQPTREGDLDTYGRPLAPGS